MNKSTYFRWETLNYAIRKTNSNRKSWKKFTDREILRLAIIAELDAVSLYEQLAGATDNETIREVLLDVAREEKNSHG